MLTVYLVSAIDELSEKKNLVIKTGNDLNIER